MLGEEVNQMYTPLPGFVHLHALVPDTAAAPHGARRMEGRSPRAQLHATASGLVRFALDIVGGLRPLSQLDNAPFAPPIHLHLRAWRRRGFRGARLARIHVRDNGEFFGTAHVGPGVQQRAFIGTLSPSASTGWEQERDWLRTFRLI